MPDGLELHLLALLDGWVKPGRTLGENRPGPGKPGLGSGSVTRQPDTRKRGNRLAGWRRFLTAGHLCALAVWVYRQRGGSALAEPGEGGSHAGS